MANNYPQTVTEVDGPGAAGSLSLPYTPVDHATAFAADQARQTMLAKHACGNLYTLHGQGSGPTS